MKKRCLHKPLFFLHMIKLLKNANAWPNHALQCLQIAPITLMSSWTGLFLILHNSGSVQYPYTSTFKQWNYQVSNSGRTASQYDYERSPIINTIKVTASLIHLPILLTAAAFSHYTSTLKYIITPNETSIITEEHTT